MKLQHRLLSFITIISLALLSACGGDSPAPSPEKTALKKLSKKWTIVKPTDGATLNSSGITDRTADFTGASGDFTLTFSGSTFTVGGSRPDPSPWPASGTWSFVSVADKTGTSGQILRNDGIGIIYSINSSNELNLAFTCDGTCNYAGNRVSQVTGGWTFVLK